MKLGLNLGYFGTGLADDASLVLEAERIGYDSVWTAEAYGSDAVTPLAYLAGLTDRIRLGAGILQMPARTPAMTAMTAVTLDKMSHGRFVLGLGVSGPQVVEGWHGRPYGKPLKVTREYVSIVRRILARDAPVTFDGDYYQIPYQGEGATGLGKPLKLIEKPHAASIPIYLAAIGPNNVRLTAEIADGWLPIFYSPERSGEVYEPLLREGFERSGDAGKRDRFDVAPSVISYIGDDIEQARLQAKPMLALYIGGMGAKGRNFYNDLARRYGYEQEAEQVQDLYLAGKKMEATLAVPDALVDEVCLVGPKEVIADRLEAWEASGLSTLIVSTMDVNTVRTIAELAL